MALISCVFVIFTYQRIVALLVPNTIVIPSMDQVTFMSTNKTHLNYMNNSQYDFHDTDALSHRFKEMIRTMPKFRYKIKEICGDYYYELMSYEEAVEKIFITAESKEKEVQNQQDIDDYIRDNMNVMLPHDGPLLRVY